MMKTVTYQELAHHGSPALNFHYILEHCRREGINRLVVEPGVYELDPKLCSQRSLNISNHGHNGPKRIAVVIEEMENFEIDFSGSMLISQGIMTPFALLNSKNITIKNVKLKNPTIPQFECRVIAHGPDYVEVENIHGIENIRLQHGYLYASYPCAMYTPCHTNVEFDGTTGEIAYGTADNTLGVPSRDLYFQQLDDSRLRIFGGLRKPPIGNVLLFNAMCRVGAGFFCENSQDLRFENVDICSCYGMGIIAQMCRNISLDNFNTRREDGLLCTAGADATHFVNCSGLVSVENSSFMGQMDDALNIHGIYTRIIDKGPDWLMVRQMHPEATGIAIYQPGNLLQVLPPDTLLPYTRKTVKSVEHINDECIKVFLNENTGDVHVGDDLENLTLNADLIFRNCDVLDNRARGMLIGTNGKVIIEDCRFHSSGTAVKFESDGAYWFESGATADVTIRNNRFDGCKYAGWGHAIIEFQPREAQEENRYFHGSIRVTGNTFTEGLSELVSITNAASFTFQDNVLNLKEPRVVVSHVGKSDLQADIAISE